MVKIGLKSIFRLSHFRPPKSAKLLQAFCGITMDRFPPEIMIRNYEIMTDPSALLVERKVSKDESFATSMLLQITVRDI